VGLWFIVPLREQLWVMVGGLRVQMGVVGMSRDVVTFAIDFLDFLGLGQPHGSVKPDGSGESSGVRPNLGGSRIVDFHKLNKI
jgi:hypothetical protein